MDPLLHNWEEVLAFLGVVFGTGTAAWIFYRKVLKKPICGFCKAVRGFFTMGTKVEYMYNELKPNSGASVKDSIKRIEDNIIVLMNKHKIIIDDYHTGIVETDAEGNITWANATYLDFTDRQLRDLLGNGWINAVAAEDRVRVYTEWQDALQQQRAFESEFYITKPNGSKIKVKGYAFPIKGKERIQGYIGKVKIIMEDHRDV